MKFKIKIIITIMVSFVVIVSMCFFIVNRNSISISGFNSDNIITGSNNSYLITLKGVPSGNGTYQQLITINNYSKYGINGDGSNIAFYDGSNLTHLYAWIQFINITTIQIWVKNFNGSSIINMQVLYSFENLFSSSGYLGEAPELSSVYGEYDNGVKVFTDYVNNNTYDLYMPNSTSPTTIDYAFSAITSGEILYQGYIDSLNSTGNNFILFASNQPANFYRSGSTYGYDIYSNGFGAGSAVVVSHTSVDTEINLEMNVSTNSSYISLNQNNAGWLYFPSGYTFSPTSSVYIQNLISNTYSDEILGHYIAIAQFGDKNIMPALTFGTSIYHSIDFKLLGSPFSSLWNIMVNGTTYQADSSNIYLNMTNGYYNIIVNLPAGYSAITKGVLYVNGTNQVYKIFVSYNNNSGFSNDIIYAIILASIIVAAAIYFSKRS